jgi:hypothetical protein
MRDVRVRFASVALGLAGVAAVVAASPALAISPAPAPDLAAMCDKIALLTVPDDPQGKQVDALMVAMLDAMYQQQPAFAEMEAKYPGMRQAISTAYRPVLIRFTNQVKPMYRADISALWARNLSAAEAKAYLAFLSDAGVQRFAADMRQNQNLSSTVSDLVKEKKASTDDIKSDLTASAIKAGQKLDMQQKLTFMAFLQSPTGVKVKAVTAQKFEIDRKWTNYSTPAYEQEIGRVTLATMADHIAKTDPATAQRIRDNVAQRQAAPSAK